MLSWIDTILQGVMLGGLYALFAIGLSLMFGVMRIVNVAHGDFAILAGFIGFFLTDSLGVNPIMAIVIVVPAAFATGYAVQYCILNHTITKDPLPSLVVTFGLSIVIQNILLESFSADPRSINVKGFESQSFHLFGSLAVGSLPLVIFCAAFLITLALQWLLGNTSLGRAFRATSDDREAALLMGINDKRMYALATAIAIGVLGIAGILHGMRTTLSPTDGAAQLIYAFEVVIIGGMGSFWGSFLGGMILGISQGIGFRIDPGWGILVGHMVFVLALFLKPNGLFPKTK